MGALDCVTTGKMQPTDSTEVFAISMSSNSTLNEPRTDLESQTPKGTGRRHSIWWTILIDIPLILIVVGLIGFFELGFLPSNPAGFFCGDPALAFSYTGDTVTTATLTSLVFLAPIVVVFIIEAIFADSEGRQARLKEAVKNTLWVYKSYLYGLIFNFAVIEVMKGVTGSPRPTFFDICEPDTALTCNGSEYVKSFKCTSTRFSAWKQRDASHSFPSGHTSLSVHCGVFIAWYLQKRAFDWRYRTVFVVPVIQLSCFLFAAISSLTRITDHRHHWWDVLAGFVIGIITFLYAAVVLCNNFLPLNNKKSQKSGSPEDSQSSDRTLIYDTERSNGLPL